jgi:hypothetical protein
MMSFSVAIFRSRACRRDLVGQIPVGREVEQEQVLARGRERLADVDEVLPEPDLAAGEIDPRKAR